VSGLDYGFTVLEFDNFAKYIQELILQQMLDGATLVKNFSLDKSKVDSALLEARPGRARNAVLVF